MSTSLMSKLDKLKIWIFYLENNPRYQCLGDKRHSGQLGWFGIWDGHRVLEQGWRTSDWIRNPRLGIFARRKTKTAEECADLCNLAGERKCHYFHWGDSKCATKLYGCPKTDCVFYSYFSKTHRIFKMTPRLNEYKKDQDDHFICCARNWQSSFRTSFLTLKIFKPYIKNFLILKNFVIL